MKISAQRDNLLKPLQTVCSVVEKRQSSPILSNILLSITGNELTLTGTDLEVEMIVKTQIESDEDGDFTLPARKLLDLCKNLPDSSNLSINADDDKALISSGRSRFTLSMLPAVEYPSIDSVETPFEVTMPQSSLKFLIEQTQFAMAQQDVRFYLNGLMFEINSDSITSVATDGHRLAFCSLPVDTDFEDTKQVIIPRKGVVELSRLLDDTEEPIKILLGRNHIRVILKDVTFTSKLIDGKFPDYQQVIPQEINKEIILNRSNLHQAFTRIAVLSNEKFRGMRLQLEQNLLRVSVHNPEQEEAEEEIEVDYNDTETFEIGFNIGYFIDALSVIKTDEIKILFTDSNHSCLIKAVGEENSKYVIMPMRL